MIGEFKTEEDANRAYELINQLREAANSDQREEIVRYFERNERFSKDTEQLLRKHQLHDISPDDIADLAFVDMHIKLSQTKIHCQTDDTDLGGFIKLMVDQGAKVQVYSAHEYPDNESK
jgi:hypothetical protein